MQVAGLGKLTLGRRPPPWAAYVAVKCSAMVARNNAQAALEALPR